MVMSVLTRFDHKCLHLTWFEWKSLFTALRKSYQSSKWLIGLFDTKKTKLSNGPKTRFVWKTGLSLWKLQFFSKLFRKMFCGSKIKVSMKYHCCFCLCKYRSISDLILMEKLTNGNYHEFLPSQHYSFSRTKKACVWNSEAWSSV